VNGLGGQVAVQHVDQARNLELFKSKHNMGAKYVMDYQRGIATPSSVQSTVNGLNGRGVVNHAGKDSRQGLFWFLQKMEARIVQVQEARSAIQKFVHMMCVRT